MLVLGAFQLTFPALERIVDAFDATLGDIGVHLGVFWLHVGSLGDSLEAPWARLGVSWVLFGGPWASKTCPKWSRMAFGEHTKNL